MSAAPVQPSAAARRPSAGRKRFVVLLATALILASSLLAGTPAGTGAATDWEVVLLGQYRLGDTESHKVLIREAVANWLESEHAASGAAAVADEVQRLAGIPKAERDRTFSGWLVARLYNGVFTDEINRTPAEQEFYEEFQGYYGSMQLLIAKTTLAEWEAYLDPMYPVQPRYGSPPTLGLLWDTGKSFSGFNPPNNAMNIGNAGFAALHEILDPAAASVIPGARAAFIRSGYNPPDGSKTAAALATAGFVGGTFAVMYGAIAAHAAATLAHVIAVTSIVNEVGTTIAGAASTALSAGSTATSFVMGAVVILPLLIAGGMKIADLAQKNTFGDKLRFAIAHPDFHADLLQITGFKTDLVDGLWYSRCNSGFEGIGTVCWRTDCPATYHLAGSVAPATPPRPSARPTSGRRRRPGSPTSVPRMPRTSRRTAIATRTRTPDTPAPTRTASRPVRPAGPRC